MLPPIEINRKLNHKQQALEVAEAFKGVQFATLLKSLRNRIEITVRKDEIYEVIPIREWERYRFNEVIHDTPKKERGMYGRYKFRDRIDWKNNNHYISIEKSSDFTEKMIRSYIAYDPDLTILYGEKNEIKLVGFKVAIKDEQSAYRTYFDENGNRVKIKKSPKKAKAFISQENLAKAIGVSVDTISNWENGRSYPNTLDMVISLGLALEVNPPLIRLLIRKTHVNYDIDSVDRRTAFLSNVIGDINQDVVEYYNLHTTDDYVVTGIDICNQILREQGMPLLNE